MITEIFNSLIELANEHHYQIEYIEIGMNQMKELSNYIKVESNEEVDLDIKKFNDTRLVFNRSVDNLIRPKYSK